MIDVNGKLISHAASAYFVGGLADGVALRAREASLIVVCKSGGLFDLGDRTDKASICADGSS